MWQVSSAFVSYIMALYKLIYIRLRLAQGQLRIRFLHMPLHERASACGHDCKSLISYQGLIASLLIRSLCSWFGMALHLEPMS